MKRLSQISSDRSRATTRKSQGLSKIAEKMDDQFIDKKALTGELQSGDQSELNVSKVLKKRIAVCPVGDGHEEKRRRNSLDTTASKRKGPTKLRATNALDLSLPKAKGKQSLDTHNKNSGDLDTCEKNSFSQNVPKEVVKDLKEVRTQEIKRLATTDGFWSSKPTSRSNSPVIMSDLVDSHLHQKTPVASLRGSRNATPDVSPSSARSRLSLKLQKKELEGEELAKLNQLLELKRLKTTDGFWSPNTLQFGPRNAGSRDESPSSASSSLERLSKKNKQLVQMIEEEKVGNFSNMKKDKLEKAKSRNAPNSKEQQQTIKESTGSAMEKETVFIKRRGRPKKKISIGNAAAISVVKKIMKKTVAKAHYSNDQSLKTVKPKGRPKRQNPSLSADEMKQTAGSILSKTSSNEEIQSVPLQGPSLFAEVSSNKPKRGRPKLINQVGKQLGKPRMSGRHKNLGTTNQQNQHVSTTKINGKKVKNTGSEMAFLKQDSSKISPVASSVDKKFKVHMQTETSKLEKLNNQETHCLENVAVKKRRKKKVKVIDSDNVNMKPTDVSNEYEEQKNIIIPENLSLSLATNQPLVKPRRKKKNKIASVDVKTEASLESQLRSESNIAPSVVADGTLVKPRKKRKKKIKSVDGDTASINLPSVASLPSLTEELSSNTPSIVTEVKPVKPRRKRRKKMNAINGTETFLEHGDSVGIAPELTSGINLEDVAPTSDLTTFQPVKKRKKKIRSLDSQEATTDTNTSNIEATIECQSVTNVSFLENSVVTETIEVPPTKHKKRRKKKILDVHKISESQNDEKLAKCSPTSTDLKPLTSDIRITPELRRLNTTAGFWAPTPDFGSVLNMPNFRRSVVKNKTPKTTQSFPWVAKPESSLLQHRKKKLNSLKQTLHKVRNLSKLDINEGIHHPDTGSIGISAMLTDSSSPARVIKKMSRRQRLKKILSKIKSDTVKLENSESSVISTSKEILDKESESASYLERDIQLNTFQTEECAKEQESTKLCGSVTDSTQNITEDMQVDSVKFEDINEKVSSVLQLSGGCLNPIDQHACTSSVEENSLEAEDRTIVTSSCFNPSDTADLEKLATNLGNLTNDLETNILAPDLIRNRTDSSPEELSLTTNQHLVESSDELQHGNESVSGETSALLNLQKQERENIFDMFSQAVSEAKQESETKADDQLSIESEGKAEIVSESMEEKLKTEPSTISLSTSDQESMVMISCEMVVYDNKSNTTESTESSGKKKFEVTSLKDTIIAQTLSRNNSLLTAPVVKHSFDTSSTTELSSGHSEQLENPDKTSKKLSEDDAKYELNKTVTNGNLIDDIIQPEINTIQDFNDEQQLTFTEETGQACNSAVSALADNLENCLYKIVGPTATNLLSKLSHIENRTFRKRKGKKTKTLCFVQHKSHKAVQLTKSDLKLDELADSKTIPSQKYFPESSSSLSTITAASTSLSTEHQDQSIPLISVQQIPMKTPLRRVRKKKRNIWKKGVVKKKSTCFANRMKKQLQSEQLLPSDDKSSKILIAKDNPQDVKGDDSVEQVSCHGQTNTPLSAMSSLKEKRMLKRLQTNANLANAVLNDEVLKGRFLRRSHPKDGIDFESSSEGSNMMTALRVDIPEETKRRRGRPRKLHNSLPQLTPSHLSGPVSRALRGKSPPHLSPQVDPSSKKNGSTPNLFTFDDYRFSQDGDIPFENVDETDLHLYLSGVSDEDQSPQKDTSTGSVFAHSSHENVELLNFCALPPTKEALTSSLDILQSVAHSSPSLPKEPKKVGRPKMKGRRGKPPGMPMTEEEKTKKQHKADAKRSKNVTNLLPAISYQQQPTIYQFFKRPRTARKSLKTSPDSMPSSTFSLRKKFTRSPLEMLEIKRRQEEAIYDMEEERKQTRRILLREKRVAKESSDGSLEEDIEVGELVIKPCSVLLSDFVKKLQLDSIESFSDNSAHEELEKSVNISPTKYASIEDDLDDEDWCADLESFESDDEEEEWRVNEMQEYRPYIPRLKLKRVVKKDKALEAGKKSPLSSTPKPVQEPIKLVIKAESVTDCSYSGFKSSLDLLTVVPSGFEASYVDFLKDCQSKDKGQNKRSFSSKPLQDRMQSNLLNATVSEACQENPTVSRKTLPGEEEDEDLLIVDLEDGVHEQNSIDSNKDSDSVITEGNPDENSEMTQQNVIQRTISNDEMGLMLSSYHDGKDVVVPDQLNLSLEKPSDQIDTNCEVQKTAFQESNITVKDNAVLACSINTSDINKDQEKNTDVIPKQVQKQRTETRLETSNEIHEKTPQSLNASENSTCEHSADKRASEDISYQSPKAVVDGKKKSMISDQSPIHSTQDDSSPDGWRLKVIHQKDKVSCGQYKCRRCDFTSSVKLTIESHIYSHHHGVQFRCGYCESEFSTVVATVTHLKNIHSGKEAQLYINRHIDERNYYEIDEAVVSDENTHLAKSQTSNIGGDGQSPPLIISLVVKRDNRRSSAPLRRYVCTHCGFSTNVKEDAEHHKNDLHGSDNLFACVLCKETIFSSEAEIKQHSISVHPSHARSYRKLPDYYDSEHLNAKGSSPSQEGDDILEKLTSILHGEKPVQDSVTVDHRQKAKDYLYLQEEWKEKTTVEADSTTEVEFSEEGLVDTASESLSQGKENKETSDNSETSAVLSNVALTSTELEPQPMVTISISSSSTVEVKEVPITKEEEEQIGQNLECAEKTLHHSSTEQSVKVGIKPHNTAVEGGIEPSDTAVEDEETTNTDNLDISADDSMGLKIIQVVSLSEAPENLIKDPIAKEVLEALAGETDQQNIAEQTETSDDITDDTPQDLTVNKQASTKDQHNITTLTTSAPAPVTASTTASAGQTSSSSSANSGLPLSYKCNACKVHTPYLLMMVKHLKARHPNMRCFACPYCKAINSFISQKQLRHHVKNAHPDKIGRNEIALSDEAKKFVEAMVLPNSSECIRVGNRIVLEEDLHTCTYCQLKMTSLAQVYEHLNNKHSDLFEFVCPVCQGFKSKALQEISIHCVQAHNSALDTDKVHVSVPKNLFHVLNCISKGGKYIEKSLSASEDPSIKQTVDAGQTVSQDASTTAAARLTGESSKDMSKLSPGRASVMPPLIAAVNQLPAVQQQVPHMVFSQAPLIAIPLMPGSISNLPTAAGARPMIAFSSALFDTSTLTSPPQLISSVAPSPASVLPSTSGLPSFLSPAFQQQNTTDLKATSPVRQIKPKHLPVLNVPNIKPRVSQPSTLVPVSSPSDQSHRHIPVHTISSPIKGFSPASHEVNNLPDTDPSPDAFKIFNLRPTAPLPPSSSPSANAPMVFPPVSSSGFIQGPIAGFPAGMVVPQNLVPFVFNQPQPMMIAPRQSTVHGGKSMRPSTMSALTSTPEQRIKLSMPSEQRMRPTNMPSPLAEFEPSSSKSQPSYFKTRNVPLLKEQQLELQRQRPTHPSGARSVSTLAGAFRSSSSATATSQSLEHRKHSEGLTSVPASPGLPRPSKGIHKRSSSIYQCPYCPGIVTLKALEVASHIQNYHPGHQVTFKKIAH
ncbi:serine-rich adhesin for platelets [Biomphalaria glabrata]|nr:serine-rich adhesin for platelets [Biomphalaria glabrata]